MFPVCGYNPTERISQNEEGYSDHSEESLIFASQTLRFAQGDSFKIISEYKLWHKGVFVMVYLFAASLVEDYCNNIEAEWSIFYFVGCEEMAGGCKQF